MTDTQALVRSPRRGGRPPGLLRGTRHSRARLILLGLCIIAGLVAHPAGRAGSASRSRRLWLRSCCCATTRPTAERSSSVAARGPAGGPGAGLGTDRFVPFDVGGVGSAARRRCGHARRRDRPRGAGGDRGDARQPGRCGRDGVAAVPAGAAGHRAGITRSGRPLPVGRVLRLRAAARRRILAVLTRAADGWGGFLAGRARPASSLVGGVQTLTRVLPPDTARQQAWAAGEPRPGMRRWRSSSPMRRSSQRDECGAMVQRHFIVVTWPLTADVRRHRPPVRGRPGRLAGADGARRSTRPSAASRTRASGQVAALTARQTVAR